jgi:chromosome segregation protein
VSAPARLLSVRLQGFKSFVDRTHVEFGPGISAVVGPNGSGKSNLADALRWALGEQGRALRSRKSEDVIWAGSERRPAVGMADVQLTLDNADGLLPVEYGVVELGRRLYRSGENDYLLNRQRVRLKDLVDLLDAGHLAENAFLFIGQGMVDQALALRPEERRPLFEEVAGVRRHERRRRRAVEQLSESAANLARVDDILGELRPQARRLGQQAEQQASRLSAADELAQALLLSAHHRWFAASGRATVTAAAVREAHAALEGAMLSLRQHEQAMAAAGEALATHAAAESASRTELDRLRAERAALQLREGRVGADIEAAVRERTRIVEARGAAESEAAAARDVLAEATPASPRELEEELAGIDADLAAMATGRDAVTGAASSGLSAADAAAIRRLESARSEELTAARRRAADADRRAADEVQRTAAAATRAETAGREQAEAAAALAAAEAAERAAREAREAAQRSLGEAEGVARSAAEAAAAARATAAALGARLEDALKALEATEGSGFSKAARARGGRSIADGLIVDPALQAAVDAALAGLARAHVVAREDIAGLAGERGVAIARESLAAAGGARPGTQTVDAERLLEQVRARGGGALVEAVRRDDAGAVTTLLARAVWLPDAVSCLSLQTMLLPGWVAVARDGSVVVGEVATWVRPEGRGLHLRADAERLAEEARAATQHADRAQQAAGAGDAGAAAARAAITTARQREAEAAAATRRAAELDRAATARAESTSRDAAWLAAQATRLQAEAARLRAAVPPDAATPRPDPAARTESSAEQGGVGAGIAVATEADRRRSDLADRRATVAVELEHARAATAAFERRRAQAEAAIALAERQLAVSARAAAELAEREARLGLDREDLQSSLADAARGVATAEANLAAVTRGSAEERERLRAAEAAASAGREQARITGERVRFAERDEVEARLALESLREQVTVELAALGPTALLHLDATRPTTAATDAPSSEHSSADLAPEPSADIEPDQLEAAVAAVAVAWQASAPAAEQPSANRLASLRRRFHDLGAVNPFAADEYAEVKARLELLEGQRGDLQSAIDSTRELIAELDRLVTDQFRRTFEALERAFDARFQQLFGGGYARLILTDPQDLTRTGVEITARPPGKKAQALAMLSGGERALTAVALLFAMLTVRPVPFCVLDEVDAALDEANIGRFTEALRELAHQTQCIVITHNRGTIEAADALYGVTVGDDSASRVISLRLDEATAIAGRSRGSAVPRPAGTPAAMAASATAAAAGAVADG